MQAIKLVTGVTPTCWRPPFGDVDNRIRAIAKALGLDTILWEYDSDDWQVNAGKATPEQVDNNYQAFVDGAKNGKFNERGGIILTHEINNYTMGEAMKWYPVMKQAFQHLVPVGVAYNKTQPYVEKDHTQPSFAEYVSGERKSSDSDSDSTPSGSGSGSQSSGTTSTGAGPGQSSSTAVSSTSKGKGTGNGAISRFGGGTGSSFLLMVVGFVVVCLRI
ncbi:hypothetical protein E1B28_011798 [Marasmius oreades]|uniref:chitin deacetylase n=1 Tax=Marasmius oreades TaxID=181124 RepID=A0A9P7RUW0_9AGAR|nr:uncharacterized protein E1B28_011798 [Marasmius oreades]KAG7090194.1 hypothetical protein E1B28_011798 [Marasmius oreades]